MRYDVSTLSDKAWQSFTLDTAYKRGDAPQANIARGLGSVLNIKGLSQVKSSDGPSVAMTRANNLSALAAVMLTKIKAEKRQDAMVDIAGFSFTESVLAFARQYPGGIGITDAIRFSLALHFLTGILDVEAQRPSRFADGYRAWAKLFKEAQQRRSGTYEGEVSDSSGMKGLGSLGLHPILFGEDPVKGRTRAQSWDKWCADNAGKTYDPALLNKCQNPPLVCDGVDPASGEGRRCRGLNTGWTPPRPAGAVYPAPPDIPSLTMSKVQAAACGDVLQPLAARQQDKVNTVRAIFAQIFGRQPNNREVQYYAEMRWCASSNQTNDTIKLKMLDVRNALVAKRISITTPQPVDGGVITPYDFAFRDVGTDVGDGLKKAADAAFDFLGKTADFITDILCKGFKAILGEAVGGVICQILTFITRAITGAAAAAVQAVVEGIKMIFAFIEQLIKGNIEAAFLELFKGAGRILFSAMAPVMVPFFMGQGKSLREGMAEISAIADRVTKRNPLFALTLIMAIVNIFPVPKPDSIIGLIIALTPMLGAFIARVIRDLPILQGAPEDDVAMGIEKFVKFGLVLYQGMLKLPEIIAQLKGQLLNYFKGNNNKGAPQIRDPQTGQMRPMSPVERIKDIVDRVSKGFQVITNAFAKVNFKDISTAAVPLLSLIPELLLAILPDAKEQLPSLTDWIDAAKQAEKDVNKQYQLVADGAQKLLAQLPLADQTSFLKKNFPADIQEAASVTAAGVARFKGNPTQFAQFKVALRAELLKV